MRWAGVPIRQCAELYPEKVILDIPSRLKITGQELANDLMAQIEQFNPTFHFQEMATSLVKLESGRWRLTTDMGTVIDEKPYPSAPVTNAAKSNHCLIRIIPRHFVFYIK